MFGIGVPFFANFGIWLNFESWLKSMNPIGLVDRRRGNGISTDVTFDIS